MKDLGQLQGTLSWASQAASYSRLPIHDTILALHGPETSTPAIDFLSLHPLSPQNEDLFI